VTGCWRALAGSAMFLAAPLAVGDEPTQIGTVLVALPTGCQVKPRQGIDSIVGTLLCRGGRTVIRYDVGFGAGNYCSDHRSLAAPVSKSGVELVLCAGERNVGAGLEERLMLVAPKAKANFIVVKPSPSDVMLLLELGQSLTPVRK
jgi:hypothetical protein